MTQPVVSPMHAALAADPMPAEEIRLSEIIGALSYALDMTEGLPPGHALRCCWIGMHLGAELGISGEERSHLYYTLLLKDAGCSSNAARLFELYGNDDRAVKRDFKHVDSQSVFQLGRFVLQHAGIGKSLHERISRIMHLAGQGGEFATELISTRCERGAAIARQLGFSEDVAMGIHGLDEHWNGKGRPAGLQGEQIPIFSRVALLAQVTEVFHAAGGAQAALDEARKRSGTWFDPEVVEALELAARKEGFWEGISDAQLQQRVMELEPHSRVVRIDEHRLDRVAEAFAQVVDAKSPYTYGHSTRVAAYTDGLARAMGVSQARRQWLRRGALLHDIGKLGVSNAVLDKPGKLTPDEWEQVKAHARYSEEILARLGIFSELAHTAGAHHERLDGRGYPRGLSGDEIGLETRIITVADVFDAITAARPYRGPVPVPEALAMMEAAADSALDRSCLEALRACLPELAVKPVSCDS